MSRANTDRFKYLMSVLHYKVNTGKLIVSYYQRPVIIAPWHKLFENLTYIFALLCLYAMVNLSFGKIAYFFSDQYHYINSSAYCICKFCGIHFQDTKEKRVRTLLFLHQYSHFHLCNIDLVLKMQV